MKKLLLLVAIVGLLASCTSNAQNKVPKKTVKATTVKPVIDVTDKLTVSVQCTGLTKKGLKCKKKTKDPVKKCFLHCQGPE